MASGAATGLSSSFGTLDVNGLVSKLMQVERNPQVLLNNRKTQIQAKSAAVKAVATAMRSLKTAAQAFDSTTKWQPLKATSSSTAVTTSASSGAVAGSLVFRVDHQAAAEKLYTTATLPATSSTVATPGRFLLAAGMSPMGLGTLKTGAGLALGAHTVAVTQAGAAVKTGATTLSATGVELTGANNTLDIEFNGATYTLNLATGTYTGPQEILNVTKAAITAAGLDGSLAAAIDSAGKLAFTTMATGESATLQIMGTSTALSPLGLTADSAAITGAARITIDGQVNEIADADNVAGKTLTLLGKSGVADAMTVTLSGALATGSATVNNVDLGDGSLSAVTNAINTSYGRVAASSIQVGTGQYRFQIESTVTGAGGELNIDWTALSGGKAAFTTLTAATDAQVTVMAGTDPAYSIVSSTDTFTNVLPGVNFTLNSQPVGNVTISASRDLDGLTQKVSDLVMAANTAIFSVTAKSVYNAETKAAGPLLGNTSAHRAQADVVAAITAAVGSSALKQGASVGITMKKDGTIDFDQSKFAAAYKNDPAAVQRLFVAPLGESDPGITQRLIKVTDAATAFATGYLATSGEQFDNTVLGINKQIEAFDVRMQMRETALRRQYSAVNSLLEQLNGRSTALGQALSSIPDISVGSNKN
jgi:flagellar hook-associated protein 2